MRNKVFQFVESGLEFFLPENGGRTVKSFAGFFPDRDDLQKFHFLFKNKTRFQVDRAYPFFQHPVFLQERTVLKKRISDQKINNGDDKERQTEEADKQPFCRCDKKGR